jgi:GntR family negative regulator for fad regulon and positive regulator of fabA
MQWKTISKPAELAESRLIDAILSDYFPINSSLPPERELAVRLGVTRPTMREALQRLARDGWLEIRHGKSTRVRDYWQEGNLAVLSAIARREQGLPDGFISNLLMVRVLMAPAYTRLAVENAPAAVLEFMTEASALSEDQHAFANFDFRLHHTLTVASHNPVFTLILNGFQDLYSQIGSLYFSTPVTRRHSREYYRSLEIAVSAKDAAQAESLTRTVMQESLGLWQDALENGGNL